MKRDPIQECGLTDRGLLYVKPASLKFPYIFREALGIQWDAQMEYLAFPTTIDGAQADEVFVFTPEAAFAQIIKGAKEQGAELFLTGQTRWIRIPIAARAKIIQSASTASP